MDNNQDFCQRCGAERLIHLSGKTNDLTAWTFKGKSYDDYPPRAAVSDWARDGWGMDYIDLTYCLTCGQIQGQWPRPDRDATHTAYGKANEVKD